jgi:phosphoglycolate phosphatase-like HAD superfamily hydrolase
MASESILNGIPEGMPGGGDAPEEADEGQLYSHLPKGIDRLILDIDGVLVDPSPSYYAVGRKLLSREGAVLSDEDITAFKWAGGFNDDWELTRAALGLHRWRRHTGDNRPLGELLSPNEGLLGVLRLVGADDPGDLSAECESLYAQAAHEDTTLVAPHLLQQVASRLPLYACTGRTRSQTLAAFAAFGLSPKAFTSCETAKKPNPHALLPLLEGSTRALFVGDTWDDCLTALNAQALTSAQLYFFWCLPKDAPTSAVYQHLRRGGHGATLGLEALLFWLLSSHPCA